MAIACTGCGSTLNLDPLAPRWHCDQCGRTNVNENVVAAATVVAVVPLDFATR